MPARKKSSPKSKAVVKPNKAPKKASPGNATKGTVTRGTKKISIKETIKALRSWEKTPEKYKVKKTKLVRPIRFKKAVRKPESIPEEQWNLPVSITANGQYRTLSEMAGKKERAFSLASLSGEDKRKLVIKRIQDTPNYPTRQMLGIGTVDKQKAIEEVQSNTPAGKFIAESEQRVIQLMIKKLNDSNNG